MPEKKHILISRIFQKNLRKLRRHFSEEDIKDDIKEFVRAGFRKGGKQIENILF